MEAPADIQLHACQSDADWQAARQLFEEYAQALDIDLEFQGFSAELANLGAEYGPPRGVLLVARVDDEYAGCVALRPIDDCDYVNAAEVKRLFVRPVFRGFGLGRTLTEAILDRARELGYDSVLLDTLDTMEVARALYADLGFEEIPPYYYNPVAGAHYLKADIK
jgi:GNAT superfamily N-acetyltransferase